MACTPRFTTVVYGVRASIHKLLATARRPGDRSAIRLLAVLLGPVSGSGRMESRSFPHGIAGRYTRTISGYFIGRHYSNVLTGVGVSRRVAVGSATLNALLQLDLIMY